MKAFEFHFNPEASETKIYETFVYEPGNEAEERSGYLYLAGYLTNVLPQNSKLLDNLASVVKKEYYQDGKGLKQGLEKGNGFLTLETKKENVSWLGNLNFVILSLSVPASDQDSQELNFTKTGDIKVLLVREDEIVNISNDLDSRAATDDPTKIFKNVSTGKLLFDDKIIVFNRDIFDFFTSKNLIKRIAASKTEKELKKVFDFYKKELSRISGFCLFVVLQRPNKRFSFLKRTRSDRPAQNKALANGRRSR